jgi:hypothetical protein
LLNPAISNEALQEAKAKADSNSIQVLLIIGTIVTGATFGRKTNFD